jgi:hypothetical protein
LCCIVFYFILFVLQASGSLGGQNFSERVSSGIRNSSSGGLGGFISMLLSPFVMIYRFLLSFFVSPPAVTQGNTNRSAGSSSFSTAAGGDRARSR